MKTSLTITSLSLFLLLLCSSLSFARPGMAPGLGITPMWWHNQQLSTKLNISEAQQDQLEAHLQISHPKMIDLKATMQKTLFALEGALGKNFNEQESAEYLQNYLNARTNIMKARMENLIATRKILTYEQFRGLREASKRKRGRKENTRTSVPLNNKDLR